MSLNHHPQWLQSSSGITQKAQKGEDWIWFDSFSLPDTSWSRTSLNVEVFQCNLLGACACSELARNMVFDTCRWNVNRIVYKQAGLAQPRTTWHLHHIVVVLRTNETLIFRWSPSKKTKRKCGFDIQFYISLYHCMPILMGKLMASLDGMKLPIFRQIHKLSHHWAASGSDISGRSVQRTKKPPHRIQQCPGRAFQSLSPANNKNGFWLKEAEKSNGQSLDSPFTSFFATHSFLFE